MPHQELYNKIVTDQAYGRDPKDLLQNIITETPYFSTAHFFLLRETPNTDHHYRKVAAKTALHFNNPFWLRYQLNRKKEEKTDTKITSLEALKINQPIQEINPVQETPVIEEIKEVAKAEQMDQPVMVEEVRDNPAVDVAQAALKETEPIKKEKEELLFEPLYTTDYFASQGIKLSEEVQSSDKLGKQLKSFTDWLKTMKKVHHGKLPESSNLDIAVQNMAEKSNKEEEVLTEAMAEVYVKQGKTEKAADIYKKLSLLNPAKSAYFAAKIELLKEN